MNSKRSYFPHIIEKHPHADICIEGLKSRLVQAGKQQLVFMEFESNVEIPSHKHNAQWDVGLKEEMEQTVNGETKDLKKGENGFIEKGVVHSAGILAGCKDVTLFDQADRNGQMQKI